ncbi:hypothetical protein ACFSVM_08035 [Paenibacillus shunpengii]|uniref:Uncharacterized protein n=1 Tax=Paenibacillus shunpengii TaxID=2054424 RepID=A0ABW5SME3_9BACL|nr:hypothetical protein [Paenibacillus sp. FSL H7-0326]OMC70741.1 hypothetical protein BK126_01050 [Paenibacillus sp. FSL H7-0326]
MNKKIKRRSIFFVVILAIVFFILYRYGYSLNEKQALRISYPFTDGDVVYNKKFENNKAVIWETENFNYVKQVEIKLGFLYQVSNVAVLQSMQPLIGTEGELMGTWSARLNSRNMYDTIFGVESDNPEIKRVIISNDNIDNVISYDMDEIKENSTVFIELILEDGFAASYNELNTKDASGFIFRGVNDKGEILILGR